MVLLAARQDWARVVTIEPHPLPASRVAVSSQDCRTTARRAGPGRAARPGRGAGDPQTTRRIVGGLFAVFGVAIVASVSLPVTAAQIRGAALGATTTQAGSVPGGSTVGSGTTPGTGGSGVAGLSLASHVEMAAFPGAGPCFSAVSSSWAPGCWSPGAVPAGRSPSRYERPASRKPPAATDPASLWESLSQGLDPTDLTDPSWPRHPGRRFRGRITQFGDCPT